MIETIAHYSRRGGEGDREDSWLCFIVKEGKFIYDCEFEWKILPEKLKELAGKTLLITQRIVCI